MIKNPVIVIGLGEMGSVFARGLLRLGRIVVPILRDTSIPTILDAKIDPELVLVSVAEKDLHPLLSSLPQPWQDRVGLLQNELLPKDWQQHGILNPTVISVWFEKKKGQDSKVLIPSPVYGPHSQLLEDALATLDISTTHLDSEEQLLQELVIKNVYILTTNITGLISGGNVGELWQNHRELAQKVAHEVIDLQEALTGNRFDRELLIHGMLHAFQGDLQHTCMGRSAPARLERALMLADRHAVKATTLREIQEKTAREQ